MNECRHKNSNDGFIVPMLATDFDLISWIGFGVGGVHTFVIISTSIPHQTICVMVRLQIKLGIGSRAG